MERSRDTSTTDSCSGRTVISLFTASVTAPASTWCGNKCSAYDKPSKNWPAQLRSSLWGIRETSSTDVQCPVKKAGCWHSQQTVGFLRSPLLKHTTVCWWCFTNCLSSSERRGRSRRALQGSKVSWGACQQYLEGSGLNNFTFPLKTVEESGISPLWNPYWKKDWLLISTGFLKVHNLTGCSHNNHLCCIYLLEWHLWPLHRIFFFFSWASLLRHQSS